MEDFLDVDELRNVLEDAGCRPKGNSALCPAHSDSSPSLSFSTTHDRVLLHCHSGCDIREVLGALNLTWDDVFDKNDREGPLDCYEYRDAENRLVYVVERLAGKRFRQRQLLPSGDWAWNLDNVPRLLYRLPQLLAEPGRWVFVVEGEKDVHTLEGLGLRGTTASGGSNGWREPNADCLALRRVCILPDNDEPGRRYAELVANSLVGVASEVKIINLDVPAKGDVSDWVQAGGTAEQLKELVRDAPHYTSGPTMSLADVKPVQVEWLWDQRVPAKKFTIMAGFEGSGKSYLSTVLAANLSRGLPMPDSKPYEGETLLITYEDDPADTIRVRAELMGADLNKLHVWDARMDPFVVPDHIDKLRGVLKAHPQIELVVIDPLISCLGAVDHYRALDVRRALGYLLGLDKTLLGIMHLTKGNDNDYAAHRVAGSHGFTALARSVVMVKNNNIRVVKSNVASPMHVNPLDFEIGESGLRFRATAGLKRS